MAHLLSSNNQGISSQKYSDLFPKQMDISLTQITNKFKAKQQTILLRI